MKDISQRLYKLHETGLCLCCPVWERHVRHVAKIVDCRWCPFVVLLTHVQVPWATSENLIAGTTSGKSWKAAKALWAIFDRRWLMRWGEHLTPGSKIMTMVMMRAMMWAFTSIWCGDVKDDGDDGDGEDDGKAEAPSPGRPLPWKGSLADIPTTLNMNHLSDALPRINSAACCYFLISCIYKTKTNYGGLGKHPPQKRKNNKVSF